ncbi:hypothetical protein [Streptomyces thermodiastaticus]|uniref:hypothetical protein n=1 Tax=Streptomyces thermodiastaticus TaxID=44061 RepID=UPI0019C2C719|nr:hypothetical protein [Streptomyces thermodiastaticus]GHF70577.1 hypothetical protein GCM10018787_18750 [Streptomyces thermodiastaticus]
MADRPYEGGAAYEGPEGRAPYGGAPYQGGNAGAYGGSYGGSFGGSYGEPQAQAPAHPQAQQQAWPQPEPYAQPSGAQGYGQAYPSQPQPSASQGYGQAYPSQPQPSASQGYGQAYPSPVAQQPSAAQAWPGQQQGVDGAREADPYTQRWQGQTWETQTHARPVVADPAAQTAYLPALDGTQTSGASAASGTHAASPAGTGPATGTGAAGTAATAPAPVQPAEPAYGPATLAGNARITDAQRARAEGRSPIIEPGIQPAGLTALLGLLLAGAAEIGTYALLVPLVVLQAVTAAGWFRLNGMWPARQGIALGFAGALVADVAVLAAGSGHAPAAILGTLGVWVLLSLVIQLRSQADPDERMYGLMATVASAALAIVATGYLAGEADAVAVGAIAVAVAAVVRALPMPTAASVVVSLLVAAGAGLAVGGMTGLGARGALLGAAAAVCGLIGHRTASYDYPSRFVHFTAGVALPLTAAAPVVWLLGHALG